MQVNLKLIEQIVKRFQGQPKVAILMSGQGSNAEAILKRRKDYPNIQFAMIVTDQPGCRAKELAESYRLNYQCVEGSVKGKELREEYFHRLGQILEEAQIDVIVYAGFMKIATPYFVRKFPGINIHPADMTLLNSEGVPKYRGMHCIKEAVDSGETYIASTVHVVDSEVDCGTAIAVSSKLNLKNLQTVDLKEIHEKLKRRCEHFTFPYIIKRLNEGTLNIHQMPFHLDGDLDFQNYKQKEAHENLFC